ncbi:MAG: hypothetical protein JWM11_5859 [Planctomycetaceae bacterium]|nr:hypothetical protein [Planctomycetaceae bacterium]
MAKRPKKPVFSAPNHLKTTTQTWFESVISEYELEEHQVRLLTLAAESWDRCVSARESIEKNGLTYDDRFGAPHSRPEIAIERDSRAAFARCLRELGLNVTDPDAPRVGAK